jgi:hypothetical protein
LCCCPSIISKILYTVAVASVAGLLDAGTAAQVIYPALGVAEKKKLGHLQGPLKNRSYEFSIIFKVPGTNASRPWICTFTFSDNYLYILCTVVLIPYLYIDDHNITGKAILFLVVY